MAMPWQCLGQDMALPWHCHGNAMAMLNSRSMPSKATRSQLEPISDHALMWNLCGIAQLIQCPQLQCSNRPPRAADQRNVLRVCFAVTIIAKCFLPPSNNACSNQDIRTYAGEALGSWHLTWISVLFMRRARGSLARSLTPAHDNMYNINSRL